MGTPPDIDDTDREFVWHCAEAFMTLGPHFFPLKEEPWDPRDGGVPPEMAMSDPDDEGVVMWKVLPSEVTAEELARVENRLTAPLPPLFRAYLGTIYILALQFGEITLPNVPSDAPLLDFQLTSQRWWMLQEAGYLAFSESDRGPLCFDLHMRRPDGDYPVVRLDREQLLELGDDQLDQRDLVQSCATRLFLSFRSLLVECFLKKSPAASEPIQA